MSVHPAKTQIRLGIRPGWSESSLFAQLVVKDPSFLHVDSEDWSDWADAQAVLSLHWAHSHIVSFVMSQLIWCSSIPLKFVLITAKSLISLLALTTKPTTEVLRNISTSHKTWAATWQNQQNEYAPSEDSDQPHEESLSAWRKLGSLATHWVHNEDSDAQADLSLHWAHTHCVGFDMSWLTSISNAWGCNSHLQETAVDCMDRHKSVWPNLVKLLQKFRIFVGLGE